MEECTFQQTKVQVGSVKKVLYFYYKFFFLEKDQFFFYFRIRERTTNRQTFKYQEPRVTITLDNSIIIGFILQVGFL